MGGVHRFREVTYFEDHYWKFFHLLDENVQEKFEWTLRFIEEVQWVPVKFLKHLEGTKRLYEIRVEVESNNYRVFCFFDAGKLIVLLNGIRKKTQKTPRKEIKKAELLMKKYFDGKQ